MPKGGIAIILGKPKGKPMNGPETGEKEREGMYEMAGKDLLEAIKAEDATGLATIVAEICRMAKSDDAY